MATNIIASNNPNTEHAAYIAAGFALGATLGSSVGIAALGTATNGALTFGIAGALLGEIAWTHSHPRLG